MTNPQEVRKALNHYVRTVLCTENPPNPDDRAYFPASRDLKNHIYKAKRAFELSKFDQHYLAKKIGKWEKSYPESRHYFRLYISVPEAQAEHIEDDEETQTSQAREFEQTLMWIHQTKWQRDMLSKYGNTMTLTPPIRLLCMISLYFSLLYGQTQGILLLLNLLFRRRPMNRLKRH